MTLPVYASPFATRVINYSRAPGQQVRSATYNDPSRALGPPSGVSSSSVPDNAKTVTLGGFGGSITLGFDHSIYRNRFNPRACDFIVYGNAFFVGANPRSRFAEAGIVEVGRDDNRDGLANDAWYLIPGSHLHSPIERTSFTYVGTAQNPLWLPPGKTAQDTWSVSAFKLGTPPFNAFVLNNTNDGDAETVYGYADLAPALLLGDTDGDDLVDDPSITPDRFYTTPDDPLTVGISPGSGGGSSFRIAWAVDPTTGLPANLDRIDFIRITTGAQLSNAVLGEYSTEVSAVADVRPVYTADWDQSGAKTVDDIFIFINDFFAGRGENGGADFDDSGATTIDDIFIFLNAWFAP
jgi:hypothetical protein